MVCQILYASEYIQGCNISKFGEGCEKCVPLFKSSLMIPIVAIGICLLIFLVVAIYIMLNPNILKGSFEGGQGM